MNKLIKLRNKIFEENIQDQNLNLYGLSVDRVYLKVGELIIRKYL